VFSNQLSATVAYLIHRYGTLVNISRTTTPAGWGSPTTTTTTSQMAVKTKISHELIISGKAVAGDVGFLVEGFVDVAIGDTILYRGIQYLIAYIDDTPCQDVIAVRQIVARG